MIRQAIPPKVRFEVFKRDNHTCRYCGHGPPDVKLEVDHVTPVCEGGTNAVENLVTACATCNRGKGGVTLEEKARPTEDVVREMMNAVASELGMEGEQRTLRSFVERLPLERMYRALYLTRKKWNLPEGEARWRYFCGICWRMIRERKAS